MAILKSRWIVFLLSYLIAILFFSACEPIESFKVYEADSFIITSVRIVDGKLEVTGEGLEEVTNITITKDGASCSYAVQQSADNQLILLAEQAAGLLIGGLAKVVLSSATASEVFDVTIEIPEDYVIPIHLLDYSTAADGKVLKINSSGAWEFVDYESNLTYISTYDPVGNLPDILANASDHVLGDMYIITQNGSQDLSINGVNDPATTLEIGDKLIFDGVDTWQLVPGNAATKVSKGGDTMTGDLSLAGNDLVQVGDVDVNQLALRDSATDTVTIKSPLTLTQSQEYTLPLDYPASASGYFLTSDLSGIMSWQNVGSPASISTDDITVSNTFTLTGSITGTSPMTFDGGADAGDIIVNMPDPSSDINVTFPNNSGTLISTGDTGTVTSGMISDGSITAGDMAADSVDSSKIADGSIALADMATDSIDGSKIVDRSIALADLATDSVDSSKITDGSIVLADMAANSVDGSKIADGSIVLADMAADSVDGSKIADGSVMTADLGALAVTAAKVANDTLDFSQMSDSMTVDTATTIAAGSNTLSLTGNLSLSTAELQGANLFTAEGASADGINVTTFALTDPTAPQTITFPDATGTVALTSNIPTNLTGLTDVNSAAVTSGNLLVADGTDYESVALSGDVTMVASGAVTIANNAVENAMMASNSINSNEIMTDAVGSDEIVAGAVGTSEIADGSIASADIAALAVTAAKIANDTVDFAQMSDSMTVDAATTIAAGSNTLTLTGDTSLSGAELQGLTLFSADGALADATNITTIAITEPSAAQIITFPDATGTVALTSDYPTSLTDLSDVNTAAVTSGNLLVADGVDYESVSLSGDVTMVASGAVTIANNAVDNAMMATDSVDSDEIAADAVGSAEIATDAVGSAEIATNAVGSAEIASNAVSTLKISDNAVTAAKLHDMGAADNQVIKWDGTDWQTETQVASEVSSSAHANLNATNVQSALAELEDEKLALTGGTLTGNLILGTSDTVSASNNSITRVADPTNEQDAATKAYVDSKSLLTAAEVSAATTLSINTIQPYASAGGSYTLTLPSATGSSGQIVMVNSDDSGVNIINLAVQSGESINGITDGTETLRARNGRYTAVDVGAGEWVFEQSLPSFEYLDRSTVHLVSDYVITTDETWEDTGISITILDEGTYSVGYSLSGKISSVFKNRRLTARLYDVTNSAAVANSVRYFVSEGNANGNIAFGSASYFEFVTLTAANTYRLEVKEEGGTTESHGTVFAGAQIYYTQEATGSIGTSEIVDGAVTAAKLNQMGAVDGDMLRYNGSSAQWESYTKSLIFVGADSDQTRSVSEDFVFSNTDKVEIGSDISFDGTSTFTLQANKVYEMVVEVPAAQSTGTDGFGFSWHDGSNPVGKGAWIEVANSTGAFVGTGIARAVVSPTVVSNYTVRVLSGIDFSLKSIGGIDTRPIVTIRSIN